MRGGYARETTAEGGGSEEVKAQEGGVHFGLGVEDGGGNFEVDFGGGVELEYDAEYSVVLATSRSHNPLRHLPLHRHRSTPHRIPMTRIRQREQNLTRDVIRQIPDDRQRTALLLRQNRVIDLQYVLVVNPQGGMFLRQQFDGAAVDFDALEVGRSDGLEEDVGECAGSGAQFHGAESGLLF